MNTGCIMNSGNPSKRPSVEDPFEEIVRYCASIV